MQVTETLSDGLKRGWTVVVPTADIEGRRSKRLAELAKTVRLPGFRPGKIPMPVVKTRFGGAVMSEVLEQSVNDATRDLLSERQLRPATEPKVEVVTVGDGKDLEFKLELELLPEIAMPDFSAIELTRLKAEPAEADVDRQMNELAARQRELVEVDEVRPAAKGEVLTVDFLGKVDDVAFPGGTGTDMDVEIGGAGFIPGFAEQMEGMTPGESKVISVTFPAEYGNKELAGKAATFDITAKKLKRAVLPALDDEFAKKLGFDEIAEVRKLITQQIQREYDQMSRLRIKRALLDALAGQCSFPVPQGMLDAEFDQIWSRLEAERKEGREDDADKGKDDDTLRAEYRAIAERRVRLGLLLAEIGRANNIAVTSDELTRAMRSEAARYQGQEQAVLEFFKKNPAAVDSLRGPIFEEKVVDFVLELAKVTDRVVSVEELAKDPDEAAGDETPKDGGPQGAGAA